jgi:cystinosin
MAPRRPTATAAAADAAEPEEEVSPFVEHPRDDGENDDDDAASPAVVGGAAAPSPPRSCARLPPSLRPPLLVAAALAAGALVGLLLPADARHLPDPLYARASNALGWAAFCAWSVSFWPQIVANRRRASCLGLSADFAALNVLGFACYALFCALLYWSGSVADEFERRTGASPIGAAVQLNDVAFACHALIASSLTALQVFWWYDRGGGGAGGQRRRRRALAPATKVALLAAVGAVGAHALAARAASEAGAAVAERARRACEAGGGGGGGGGPAGPPSISAAPPPPWTLLDVAYTLSAVKMAVTLVKYVPQAAHNFRRRSTVGWSITNILLDFSGGLCSLAQQLLGAAWWRDLRSVVSANPVRFALSVVSLAFDLLFVVQHYVLFRLARGGGVVVVEGSGGGRGKKDGARRGDRADGEAEEEGDEAEARRRPLLAGGEAA